MKTEELVIVESKHKQPKPNTDQIPFGRTFTDDR